MAVKKGNGVTRKHAEKILLEIPTIAERINKDDKHFQSITRIAVYGSFVHSDKEILGDLDLAVQVSNKYAGEEDSRKFAELMDSFNSGSYEDRFFKACDYIFKCLVNGRKCLHINPYSVLKLSGLSEGRDYKVIYNLENHFNVKEDELLDEVQEGKSK